MVEGGAIDLQPGFQRRERWNVEKQSALVESFLLNVPVPPVYLAEEEIGTYTAIDGKQRLRAIADFIKNRLALKHLERLKEADGLHFRDTDRDRERIDATAIPTSGHAPQADKYRAEVRSFLTPKPWRRVAKRSRD
jgi:hypothetical protein